MNPENALNTLLQPNSIENLLLFLVPGFVAFKLDQQLRPQVVRSATDAILEIIAYSLVNDLLWSPLYSFTAQTGFPRSLGAWLLTLVVVVISPAVLTVFYARLVDALASRGVIPSPISKPWDHFFSRVTKGKEIGVILTLTDGSQIAGVYKPPAFASSFPAEEQLLLAETWSVGDDGGFKERIKDSLGLLIDKDDILLLEFYEWPQASQGELRKDA
jgi:hypothetical protein